MAPRILYYHGLPKRYLFNERRPWNEFQWPALLVIGGLHAGALAGLAWHLFTWSLPAAEVVWTTVLMYLWTGFGVTLGYHRLFTHEGYQASKPVEALLVVGGGLSLEGPIRKWIEVHWEHHIRSDCPGDPHSPYQYPGWKGVMWAHIGWMLYTRHLRARDKLSRRYQQALNRPIYLWQERYYWVLTVATFAVPFLIGGWDGLFIAGFLRLVFVFHITWCINSVCHLIGRPVSVEFQLPGTDSRSTRHQGDNSRNVWWLGLITFGESYHALHHLWAKVAYHGWGKWDLDPSKWVLIVAERLRLVKAVAKPPLDPVLGHDPAHLPDDSLIRSHQLALAA